MIHIVWSCASHTNVAVIEPQLRANNSYDLSQLIALRFEPVQALIKFVVKMLMRPVTKAMEFFIQIINTIIKFSLIKLSKLSN